MSEPLSVRQVNNMVKMLLETNALLKRLTVSGEITDYRRQSSGHLYFSLKDESGKIRCVQFKNEAVALDFEPENGLEVVVTGRLSVYEGAGQYQIIVNRMIPGGTGLLFQRFEALKQKLSLIGWFDADIKKPLPDEIRRVGIVTSPSGAVIRDMISVITRRDPSIELLLCPANVQGKEAAESIASGIERLCRQNVDVIIIGRGGGSLEDLWCFNEERVASAIHYAAVPVISAVGHETDFTISDFTADFRAPTPSVAGEMVSGSREIRISKLEDLKYRMLNASKGYFDNRKRLLKTLEMQVNLCSPKNRVDNLRMELDILSERLQRDIYLRLEQENNRIDSLKKVLPAYDPTRVLNRGYALIYNKNGKLINSRHGADAEDTIKIRFSDGCMTARVQKEA